MNKKRQLLLNLALTIFFVLAVIVRGPNLNPCTPTVPSPGVLSSAAT